MFSSPLTFKISLIGILILFGYTLGSLFPEQPATTSLAAGSSHTPPQPIEPFELVDHHKQPFTLEQLTGKWSLLFLGYTHCPDVCPATLTEMNYLYQALQRHAPALLSNAQFILVSIDPERDTPDHLREYITFFNERFIATTGTMESLNDFTHQLGLRFYIEKITISNEYVVEHSSDLLLINPEGEIVASFVPPYKTEDLIQDYLKLRQQEQ